MKTSNTKEDGLENLIVNWLVNNNNFEQGQNADFNKDYAIDEFRLFRFLKDTQPVKVAELHILDSEIEKTKFLTYLSEKLRTLGIIDIFRKGLRYKHLVLDMFFVIPSTGNAKAVELFKKNIYSVTRQLMYSKENARLALDFAVFINGLPVATFELKNQLTKQNVDDAVQQYKKDRDPKELIFNFKRCIVHFAVDDNEVKMCTELKGKSSWFLPFNKGTKESGAGNPPNENGLKTDYLWKYFLTKVKMANIIENYTQVIEEVDEDTGKKSYKQVFPRYHQISVVESLLSEAQKSGTGQKFLIQHSAGSGKSNSIAWLAHQLVTIQNTNGNIFDTVIVVTDRINLDKQIKNTIKQFMQVSSTVGWANDSTELKKLLAEGKKIIITIVHKFQFILDDIESFHQNSNFAIVIDEAHSSQSGSLSAKMNIALSGSVSEDDDELEDKINTIIDGRKMLPNASYFAFTATPKNKTLEIFGIPYVVDGKTKHRPYHTYTMKQAIEEGFIKDVLRYYTPVQSFYKIAKTVENDPMFDKKKAQKKLRSFVESDSYAIAQKADMMVDHFHSAIISKGKVGGKARAMVVTSSIARAIEYYYAITKKLEERKSQFKAIVAFSGSKEYGGKPLNEVSINGFPSAQIEKMFKKDPYRILVVADKFQTGFDEPLLHTMYVDKVLTGIKAVQTLSRLNRAIPQKTDTFILDFANDTETIRNAFSDYYKTTILSDETDANKLNDLIVTMEDLQVYNQSQIDILVTLYLNAAERDKLDPILDICVENYKHLEFEEQIEFKSSAKTFTRTYNFLSAILPYGSVEWEKLTIFLTLLIPKLPSPRENDLSEGILEAVDLESYRAEAQTMMSIALEDEDAEIDPIPVGTDVGIHVPDMDFLSNILASFHEMFGDKDWTDTEKTGKNISELPEIIRQDEAYQNAIKNSDRQNARVESERALKKAVMDMMSVNMEIFKAYNSDASFKQWLSDMVFNATYNMDGANSAGSHTYA
ncbi:DEAD/DEAH box helicase family protein [Desulfosporosinus sp. Sb-LF]|uniref:type I restriction endonuclease subunit R n=1 Tax=Desulfosporosinus sp. Sb-LF TaxID=2560027 RepID=UPI00107FCF40|nr:DEAD/DEAH box helicase family protein [Desulfosporosinus sp. Sb-LF]TGE31461.1 type I restriction endonuclease subunit R [Desulfosporosinus sp. Sb-LF]